MRRGEANTLDTGFANLAEQLCEARRPIAVTPVGVDILTEERNLTDARAHKRRDLI